MKYGLKDLLDIPKLRGLLDSLEEVHSLPNAVVDLDGTVLTATGWQDICVSFHRSHPDIEKKCLASDRSVLADPANLGSHTVYQCPMGLVDAAKPLVVAGRHIGNVFVGQFFLAPAERSFFVKQARQYGFDEVAYLAAMDRVPVISEEKYLNILAFIHSLTQMVAEHGLQRRQQEETEAELRRQNSALLKSQQLLKESEDRFRALHDASFGGVVIHDQGIILDCNQELCEMTGYHHDELIGMDGFRLIEPGFLDVVLENVRKGFSGAYEVEGIRKDGSVYPLAIRGKNIMFRGRPVRVIEFRDITVRKRAERALQESEGNLRNILVNLPVAIGLTNQQGRITFRNKRFIDLFGYTEEDMPTIEEWWQLAYPDQQVQAHARKTWAAELERGLEEGAEISPYEFSVRCKDGASRVVDISAIVLGAEVLTIFVDMTERKKMEEELKHRERHIRDLIEQSPIGLMLCDMSGARVLVNPAYANMLGYSVEEALNLSYLDLTPERYRESEVYLFEEFRKTGRLESYEKEYYHKDGHLVPVRINSMLVERNGAPYIWTSVEDISAIREAEKEKNALAEQLRQSQKMEAIGTLAGGIAHDFNNILAAILGYTQLNLRNPRCDDKLRKNLQHVLAAAGRAKDLVRQILMYSRKGDEARDLIHIHRVIMEAIALLKKTIPVTVTIREQIDPLTGRILANSTQIHQVVMNLCTNAYHALPEQGGIIDIRLDPLALDGEDVDRLPDLKPGRYARLTVTDNGTGIPADIIERIFDPFFTTKKHGEGTGMGLAVTQGIVQSHQGAISVSSDTGQGTSFEVFFPLAAPSAGEEEPVEDRADSPRGHERILLVDDEDVLVNLGKEMLEMLGYRVATATSGEQALALFTRHPDRYDLIVTDQTMPGVTGDSLAEQINRLKPDLPVIICTGHSAVLSKPRVDSLGIRAVLLKPVDFSDLARTIRTIFD